MGRTPTAVRRGELMARLEMRPTRIGLLAWSYLDAVLSSSEEVLTASAFSSRTHQHNGDLWPFGSYDEFGKAMDVVREQDKHAHHWFWDAFVSPGRENPSHIARVGLANVAAAMPEFVYVPSEISEARGYKPSDARQFCGCRHKFRRCPGCKGAVR